MLNTKLLREPEAAKYLGLGIATFQSLRKKRLGPTFIKLNERRFAYALEDLNSWIEGRKTRTKA